MLVFIRLQSEASHVSSSPGSWEVCDDLLLNLVVFFSCSVFFHWRHVIYSICFTCHVQHLIWSFVLSLLTLGLSSFAACFSSSLSFLCVCMCVCVCCVLLLCSHKCNERFVHGEITQLNSLLKGVTWSVWWLFPLSVLAHDPASYPATYPANYPHNSANYPANNPADYSCLASYPASYHHYPSNYPHYPANYQPTTPTTQLTTPTTQPTTPTTQLTTPTTQLTT